MYSHETFIKLQLTEQELKKTLQKLEAIKFAINQASIVSIMDHRGIITFVNRNFCEVSKYSEEELIGHTHQIVHSGVHCKQFFEEMWTCLRAGKPWKGEICNRAKDNSLYWVEGTIVPFLDNDGRPYQYISIQNDITKRKAAEKKIINLISYDKLTGLPNRKQFMNLLDKQLEIKEPTSVFVLNIERFTVINDTLGHDIGDRILLELSKRLMELRFLKLSRLTADEFAFFIPYFNKDEQQEFNEYLINMLQAPFYIEGFKLTIKFRIGVSHYPEDGLDSEMLINNCRMAMRNNRLSSDSLINQYESDFNNIQAIQLFSELMNAIGTEQLKVFYQPRVNIETGEIDSVEALLRWQHPQLGLIDPSDYMELAEKVGLTIPIGEWFVNKVCSQMQIWQKKGYSSKVVSLCLSPRYVNDKAWRKSVRETLKETGIKPEELQIDLRTNKNEYSEQYLYKTILLLKKLGLRVGFANVGTSHTRLSDLKIVDIDCVVFDSSLINDIHLNVVDEEFVFSLLSLCNRLNKAIVVKGVEKREEFNVFKKMALPIALQGAIYDDESCAEDFEMHMLKGKCAINTSSRKQIDEKRKFYRIDLAYPIIAQLIMKTEDKEKTNKNKRTEILIDNIGPGGARILTATELARSRRVKLSFCILNQKIDVDVQIAHGKTISYGLFAYGVFFDMKESERDRLLTVLNKFSVLAKREKFVPNCNMIKESKIKFLLKKQMMNES